MLRVQMLGDLSLEYAEGDEAVRVCNTNNRAKGIWLLIAYLIYRRKELVRREELIRLIGGEERHSDYDAALRHIIWRTRNMLQPISSAMEQELIVGQNGDSYGWNQDVSMDVDAERFEALCLRKYGKEEEKKQKGRAEDGYWRDGGAEWVEAEGLREAVALYHGVFLNRFSNEDWVRPLSVYYNNLYLEAVTRAYLLFDGMHRQEEAEALYQNALPYSGCYEPLQRARMSSLMETGAYKEAEMVYDRLKENLQMEANAYPDEQTELLYRELRQGMQKLFVPPEHLLSQLREKNPPAGTKFCSFENFRLLYQVEGRNLGRRRHEQSCVGILSVEGEGETLPGSILHIVMEQLRGSIEQSLRIGDVAARCSASQFCILLMRVSMDNSRKILRRITDAFNTAQPDSPARIHADVFPVEIRTRRSQLRPAVSQ